MYTGNKKIYPFHINLQFLLFTILSLFIFSIKSINANKSSSIVRAGLRSSIYGIDPFPDTTWWYNASYDMASRFDGASPSVIWILGYTGDDGCYLNFPNPNPDSSYSKIYFSNKDENETYLDFFDRNGIQVWLQVEPGQADVLKLIDLVFTQYGDHSSIIGFGVDVEWYKTSTFDEGKAVSDSEAEDWVTRINSYNENYLLFTKHWLIEKMPPTYRKNMVFVDDSQIFPNMNSMINEFTDWAAAFSPAKVTFQFGYPSDKPWWNSLNNPPKDIGDEILKRCPNTSDLFWVDFTAYDIWPQDFKPTSILESQNKINRTGFNLYPVYPNPFNPGTTIKYSIPNIASSLPAGRASFSLSNVQLKVYDVLGREITTLVNKTQLPGNYEVTFNASDLPSGIYFLVLQVRKDIQVNKMVLMK